MNYSGQKSTNLLSTFLLIFWFFSILVEGINYQFADGYPKYEISDHQYLRFEVH